jgi:predicted transcriptional regulator
MGILVEKGHLKFRDEAGKYVYTPTRPRHSAGKSAFRQVLETFYQGSLEKAVAAFLQSSSAKISDEELTRLQKIIDEARKNDTTTPQAKNNESEKEGEP